MASILVVCLLLPITTKDDDDWDGQCQWVNVWCEIACVCVCVWFYVYDSSYTLRINRHMPCIKSNYKLAGDRLFMCRLMMFNSTWSFYSYYIMSSSNIDTCTIGSMSKWTATIDCMFLCEKWCAVKCIGRLLATFAFCFSLISPENVFKLSQINNEPANVKVTNSSSIGRMETIWEEKKTQTNKTIYIYIYIMEFDWLWLEMLNSIWWWFFLKFLSFFWLVVGVVFLKKIKLWLSVFK